jgi:misacylated tRNA(Ala) deacylase
MTRELFYNDAYQRSCTATVVRHDDAGIVLDATLFYPLGGGQPGDSGILSTPDGHTVTIKDTRRDRETREIVHVVEAGAERLAPGTEVTLTLDWERRHRHMRMHTCMHLLSAVIKAGVTGGNLTDTKGRLDFDAGDMVIDADHVNAELARLIAADLPLSVRHISGEALAAQPELIKTLSVTPPMHLPDIRLVEIEGADLQPCGGTHVARTGEIGAVKVAKIESKGARNRRVVLAFEE